LAATHLRERRDKETGRKAFSVCYRTGEGGREGGREGRVVSVVSDHNHAVVAGAEDAG